MKLTDRFCSGVKSTGAQVDYYDEQEAGLFLRVSAQRKAWGLLFTRPSDGKRARTTFGSYPSMTLAAARGRVIELRSGLDEGQDASAKVREIKSGVSDGELTLKQLGALFLADRRQRGRRTADEMERALKIDIYPVIGSIAVQKLKRIDLSRVTDLIKQRGSTVQANRVAALLKTLLAWSVDQGHLETDPGYRWKPPSEIAPPRERALSASEIKQLWHGLEQADMSRWTVELLRFCLATACRQGEAGGMLRSELDLEQGVWHLPASRSKNKRPHSVPLSPLALDVLNRALTGHELPAVFPGARGTPITNSAVSRAVQRSQKSLGLAQWTSHDLRRSAATHMAELGISPFDIGLCLNHISTTQKSITTSTYVKYTFDKEKRAALSLWGERLAAIVAGDAADILPLNSARRRYGLKRKARAA
ncbi:tyrosine-type recombinase/integrase [Bosea sp. 685]|uniref:tyrosine-type recombinase/integrase n=1 Tax=Bosea sp. 685 TaxID=3080057 RepID=UPI002892E05C|nr:tyrosine-type recombinase/integrase [Bosea sp. 685]WNJ93018.1 tyrosine-type recombinase/integrase [Bosea sp. 685]